MDQQEPTQDLAREATREAFDALYRRTLPSLVVWASLRIPPTHRSLLAAEDVVQEVWIRALRAFDAFDASRGSFRAWIFGVAKNVLLDATRQLRRPDVLRRVQGEASSLYPVEHLPDEVTAVSQRVARSESVAEALKGLAHLDREERDLVVHCGLEEMRHEDVARLLGLGRATVTKRWQRLRARLKETGLFDVEGSAS